jgi:CubicO group peptidase (beta-lactamase class C family)
MLGTARSKAPILSLLVTLVALLAGGAVAAQGAYEDVSGIPEGPVGGHIKGLLKAFDSDDPEVAWAFIEEHFTPAFRTDPPKDVHLGVFAQVREDSRGFQFIGIRHYTDGDQPNRTVAIVRNRLTEAWEAFVLETEPAAPFRIDGLQISAARPPSNLPPPEPIAIDRLGPELGSFAKRMAEAGVFSGAVLLAREDKILYKGAFGQASKRFDVPNRVDTKFNLGSMNKMFTGVATAILVEQGKLSFDDPISKYLDEDWLPQVDKTTVKVKHLLTHTAGLGSYFNDTYVKSSRELFREVDDYKMLVAEETLAFEPGTDWSYSNTGMLIAGAVIEGASGRNYFDFVREEIYAPAGMVNTDCYDMDRPVPNLAIGYTKERTPAGVGWTNNLYQHVIRGGPAGGGFSTVEDLYRFARALVGGKLVGADMVKTLTTPKPDAGAPNYGYGFGIGGEPGDRIVGHSGGFSGISSNLDIHLDTGFVTVVMSNYSQGSQAVDQKMGELLRRVE